MNRDMAGKRKHLVKMFGGACQVCGYGGMVEVHHIVPVCKGGTNNIDNLVLLCELCHCLAHGWKKKKYIDKDRELWQISG